MLRRFQLREWAVAVLATVAAVLPAVCPPAEAATLQQLSVDQMTQLATSIVRAKVAGSYTGVSGSATYTHYKLQVAETWKGGALPEVVVPGGAMNGFKQSFPGVPDLKPDTDYVLFLWVSPSTGTTHLLGLTQGVFHVSTQPDGSLLAVRPRIGELILDSTGRKVADTGISIQFGEMKSRVRTQVAKPGTGATQ